MVKSKRVKPLPRAPHPWVTELRRKSLLGVCGQSPARQASRHRKWPSSVHLSTPPKGEGSHPLPPSHPMRAQRGDKSESVCPAQRERGTQEGCSSEGFSGQSRETDDELPSCPWHGQSLASPRSRLSWTESRPCARTPGVTSHSSALPGVQEGVSCLSSVLRGPRVCVSLPSVLTLGRALSLEGE